MTKVNRILAGIIAAVMIISLTACGGSDDYYEPNGLYDDDSEPYETDEDYVDFEDIYDDDTDDEEEYQGVEFAVMQDPPDDADVVLLAEDAALLSSDMVLEPDSPPYNIGGWGEYSTARWVEVTIPSSGFYEVGLYYSREYTDEYIEGTFAIYPEGISVNFSVDITGDVGDWSEYTYKKIAEIKLDSGDWHTIEIHPNYEEHELPEGECLFNLRSVMLTLTQETAEFESVDAFESYTLEQQMAILRYDALDMGSPWSTYPPELVHEFIAWYVNDRYDMTLSADEIESALETVTSYEDDIDPDDRYLREMPRFYLVCVYYELYPTQEAREYGMNCTTGTPLEFGDNPTRALADTDAIPSDYY